MFFFQHKYSPTIIHSHIYIYITHMHLHLALLVQHVMIALVVAYFIFINFFFFVDVLFLRSTFLAKKKWAINGVSACLSYWGLFVQMFVCLCVCVCVRERERERERNRIDICMLLASVISATNICVLHSISHTIHTYTQTLSYTNTHTVNDKRYNETFLCWWYKRQYHKQDILHSVLFISNDYSMLVRMCVRESEKEREREIELIFVCCLPA